MLIVIMIMILITLMIKMILIMITAIIKVPFYRKKSICVALIYSMLLHIKSDVSFFTLCVFCVSSLALVPPVGSQNMDPGLNNSRTFFLSAVPC